ncbi:ATP-binding protein [Streptomyces sp. MAR4 CNY-716]
MRDLRTVQSETTPEQAVVWRWRRHRRCVALARSQLRRTLAQWKLPDLTDKAVSVLSELLANAVVHARVPPGREIETRFIPMGTGVRIEVHDASDERPVLRAPDESGGFGLQLVDRLSTRWGVEERDGVGKCVWADVTETGVNEPFPT